MDPQGLGYWTPIRGGWRRPNRRAEAGALGWEHRYLHVCRLEQQVPQGLVVVRGKDVVFCVDHIQAQRAQIAGLEVFTAAVSGLQEVPGSARH